MNTVDIRESEIDGFSCKSTGNNEHLSIFNYLYYIY